MNDHEPTKPMLFTIGHSNHEISEFVDLLRVNNVTAIADVRSRPYSQFNPQFNREVLEAALNNVGIRYVFMGDELGARRSERECYEDGKAKYERIAQTQSFQSGLARIEQGLAEHRIALMCAEKDPLTCHRTVLIGRALKQRGVVMNHILEDGEIESTQELEQRLLVLSKLADGNLFGSQSDLIEEAYRKQGDKIAYTESDSTEHEATYP